jgi:hypothetical protein
MYPNIPFHLKSLRKLTTSRKPRKFYQIIGLKYIGCYPIALLFEKVHVIIYPLMKKYMIIEKKAM